MQAGKGIQLVQRAGSLEGPGIELQGMGAGIAAGAAVADLLHRPGVRGAVGPQEEAWIATGGHFHQRRAVDLALEHRQAVPVRTQPAREDGIAVVEQVLWRDGGAQHARLGGVGPDVLGRLTGGDVLEHDLQLRQPGAQRDHHAVDEDGFTVEDIHVRIRDLAVHQQRHASFGHGFQHRNHPVDGAHARIGIGGGTRRIELDGRHHVPGSGLSDLVHRGLLGEIERHQRLEACRLGLADLASPHGLVQREADAVTIGRGLGHRGDGRAQVGHDDGTAKLACTGGHDRMEGGTVTQMQVPVVGGSEGQRIHGAMICRHAIHRAMVDEAVRPNQHPTDDGIITGRRSWAEASPQATAFFRGALLAGP